MIKRNFVILLVLSNFLFSCNKNKTDDTRPNIIIILADDMGFSDIGCYGSEINTPNLDKLANEGVRFSRMYNNAKCCPSRAALLTGLYPHQAGVGEMTDVDLPIPEYQGYLNNESVTIADVLGAAGYSTYLSGKWHLGEEPGHWPLDNGFDECFAFINGASSYFDFKPYRSEDWPPGNELKTIRNNKQVFLEDNSFYTTDLYTDEAISFIKNNPDNKPFFLYLAYNAPHWPLHALPGDIKKYEGKYNAGWEVIREKRYENLKNLGLINSNTQLSEKNKADREWDKLSVKEKKYEARLMEVYAAMVDRMDQNIGRLIDGLKSSEEFDNTIILFLSDNGGCRAGRLAGGKYIHERFGHEALPGTPESFTGYGQNWANVSNTPFREFKSDIHEGGIATPFIIWNPGIFPAGKINHTVTHIVDILPTVIELAGTSYPDTFNGNKIKPAEGKSLVEIASKNQHVEGQIYFFEHQGRCGVISRDWKIVRFRDKPWELYNIKNDRGETTDIAKQNPALLNELADKYDAWASINKVLPREEVEKQMIYKF